LALSDDDALIGAPFDDGVGADAGSAYLFRREGSEWVEAAKWIASDGTADDWFGFSVSLSGDWAAVGAPGAGVVRTYRREGGVWSPGGVLGPGPDGSGDSFGWSVCLADDALAVGAPGEDGAGAVRLFRLTSEAWTPWYRLTGPDPKPGDRFGWSVSLSNSRLAVGACEDEAQGTVSVFRTDGAGWSPEAFLTAPDPGTGDQFGWSVSLDGAALLVGAPLDDSVAPNGGAAYAYRWSPGGWNREDRLEAAAPRELDEFGNSVWLEGDKALVGARLADVAGLDYAGAGTFFRREGASWLRTLQLEAPDPSIKGELGWSVALRGEWALLGAVLDDDNGWASGSAYFWNLDGAQPSGAGAAWLAGE